MAFEKRDMSGALFANNRKEKDAHPDRTGYIVIGDVEYWLSAWDKAGANGSFLSLAVKPKDDARDKPPQKPIRERIKASEPRTHREEMDDEIPF